MRFSTKVGAVLGAVALTASLGTATAFAGVTPTPTPTRTFPVPQPRSCDNVRPITFAPTNGPTDGTLQPAARGDNPTVKPTDHRTPPPVVNPLTRCRPEHFNLAIVLGAGNTVITNYANFTGPVAGTGSDDLSVSTNTSDRFSLPGPGQRVNLLHTGIPFPSVNLTTCTAAVVQLGIWRFNGGPVFSVFRHAIGNGTFRLVGLWHFPSVRGTCSLRFIGGNPLLQNRINPDFTVIGVRGDGLARR